LAKPLINIQSSSEAEAVFYEAFLHCDVDVMTALWAEGDVICVHPGSGIISGHDAVVRSWQHILTNSRPPDIRYTLVSRSVSGDLAVHFVQEEIHSGEIIVANVIATNVYRRARHGWQIVEHHASIVQAEAANRTLQ